MSGPRPSQVSATDTQGPVNAGDGAQYNSAAVHNGTGDQNFFHGDVEDTHRAVEDLALMRERVHVRSRWLRTLRSRFVAPPGTDEKALRERLAQLRCLVVTGEPGQGRGTLAHLLLVPEGEEERGLREVLTEDDGFWYTDDPAPGERLLLDLTRGELEDPKWPDRLRHLVGRVADAGAVLVVIIDRHREKKFPQELRDHLVRPGRPDPKLVLATHLRAAELPIPDGARTERLNAWLDAAGTGEVAELARRAGETLAAGSGAEAVAEWVEAVLGAGHVDVDDDLDGRRARSRAVLLAVAFLEGARLEQVSAAAASLLEHTGGPGDEEIPIERASFTAELRGLGAVVTGRRARFTDPWRAQVLREVLWDGHPHLQGPVAGWVDRCVTGEHLPERLRDQIARHWAEQVLRAGRPQPLLDRARDWGTRGHGQAHLVLVEALGKSEQSHLVRRCIYQWSTRADLPVPFALTLVRVCAGDMVMTHPDQALVRLRHLAEHRRAEVAGDARRRIRLLATGDPSLFRAQLHALTTVLRDPARRVRNVHLDLFADVTRTDVLDAVGTDGRQVVDGLIALLERRPESLSALLAPWLVQPEHRLRWLVAAVHETGHLGELYARALRTPTGSLGPDELRRHAREVRILLSLIDRAQGLAPGASPVKETP